MRRSHAKNRGTREERFIRRLRRQFPVAELMDGALPELEPMGLEQPPGELAVSQDTPPGDTVYFVGGGKYDEEALIAWVRHLPHATRVVTGDGRGAERRLRELRPAVQVLNLRPDFYLHVMDAQACELASTALAENASLVVCGTGGRPNLAKGIAKRVGGKLTQV